MPTPELFVGSKTSSATEAYYSTLLHELTHWTAAEPRCNRPIGGRFGRRAYAMEELIAELGAAFLCADLQISGAARADHAHYIRDWLSVLRDDKKAIFTAASQASKAVEFLKALQPKRDREETSDGSHASSLALPTAASEFAASPC